MNLPKATSGLGVGMVISALCVAYQSLYRAIPANADVLLGLPIGKAWARPELYSPYDLLIDAGIRGPFHLYKYLGGLLEQWHANVDLVWEVLFLVFLFLSFWSWWAVAVEVTGDKLSAAVATALLAVAHPLRGTLHAAGVPIASFVTALAAMPFAIGAVLLLLRRKHFASVAMASAVFNLHPYVGLLAASATGIATLVLHDAPIRRRIGIVLLGGAFALPNALYLLSHLPSAVGGLDYDFVTQFRQYALHAFVDDHWREGYGWFFLQMAGVAWCGRWIRPDLRKAVWIMFGVWIALMAVYAVNTVTVQSPTIILMFLFRATYFIKPLAYAVVVHGLLHQWQAEAGTSLWLRVLRVGLPAAILFGSAILPMDLAVAADTMALVAWGGLIRLHHSPGVRRFSTSTIVLGTLLLCVAVFIRSTDSALLADIESVIVGVVVVAAIALGVAFARARSAETTDDTPSGRPHSRRHLIVVAAAILFAHHAVISVKDRTIPFAVDTAGIQRRIAMHSAPLETADLMDWVRTESPSGALFAVPPDGWDDFGQFRLVAERGLYATIMEVNQLAFDPSVYRTIHERLAKLGTKFLGRRQFDTRGYAMLSRSDWMALHESDHIDFAVLKRESLHGSLTAVSPAFGNERWVIIDLSRLENAQRVDEVSR